ncbi:MAG: hypothetical protein ACTHJH_03650, partial [Marmoricola sp.]
VISVAGVVVFFGAGAWPVGLLFVGLTGVYVSDFFVGIGMGAAEKLLGLFHVVTGLWLMYLTFATLVNISSGWSLPA